MNILLFWILIGAVLGVALGLATSHVSSAVFSPKRQPERHYCLDWRLLLLSWIIIGMATLFSVKLVQAGAGMRGYEERIESVEARLDSLEARR